MEQKNGLKNVARANYQPHPILAIIKLMNYPFNTKISSFKDN